MYIDHLLYMYLMTVTRYYTEAFQSFPVYCTASQIPKRINTFYKCIGFMSWVFFFTLVTNIHVYSAYLNSGKKRNYSSIGRKSIEPDEWAEFFISLQVLKLLRIRGRQAMQVRGSKTLRSLELALDPNVVAFSSIFIGQLRVIRELKKTKTCFRTNVFKYIHTRIYIILMAHH